MPRTSAASLKGASDMAKLTGAGKVAVVSGALVLAAAGAGKLMSNRGASVEAVPPAACARVSPTTGEQECWPLSHWEMMALTECPAGWVPVGGCPVLGTGGDPTPEPTAPPEPTLPQEPSETPTAVGTPGPTPQNTPQATPRPTTAPTSVPPTPSSTPAQPSPCVPVRVVRWANVSPAPVGIVLQAIAGQDGGEVWTPADERWHLEAREVGERTAAGGFAIGAGLVELRGTAVQVVDGREVRTSLPVTLVWPCEQPR
jgi:hypothetical protein